jgi:hypothetical protein
LNFSGNNVNLFNNFDNDPAYNAAINQTIAGSTGHNKLYLKGGEGTQTFIELFSDYSKLKELWDLQKAGKLLINDASLTFTIDESTLPVGYKFHPNRVYLFDADNNKVLVDYLFDSTTNTNFPKLSKFIFGGIINNKKTYQIRITEHIANLLKSDTEDKLKENNVRLGLVITEDIARTTFSNLRTELPVDYTTTGTKQVKFYPLGAVLNPLGTVLYGNTNDDNRVRFKISYTKPN